MTASFAGNDRQRCDVENLLLYNVGISAFAHLRCEEVVLARSFAPPAPPPQGDAGVLGYRHRYGLAVQSPAGPSGGSLLGSRPWPFVGRSQSRRSGTTYEPAGRLKQSAGAAVGHSGWTSGSIARPSRRRRRCSAWSRSSLTASYRPCIPIMPASWHRSASVSPPASQIDRRSSQPAIGQPLRGARRAQPGVALSGLRPVEPCRRRHRAPTGDHLVVRRLAAQWRITRPRVVTGARQRHRSAARQRSGTSGADIGLNLCRQAAHFRRVLAPP